MISVPEAAQRAKRNPETIRRWIREGKLTSWKVGTQYLIDEDDLSDAIRGVFAGAAGLAGDDASQASAQVSAIRRGRAERAHRLQEVLAPYRATPMAEPATGPALGDVWLPQIVGRIVRAVDPVRIILFGSRARGDGRPDSDYDLLVVLDHADDRRALRLQVRSAIDDLPISKDVVIASVEQVDERRGRTWGVLQWALEEGVVIYARA